MRDRLVGRAHTEEEKKKNTVLRPVKSTLADVESMKEVRKRKKKMSGSASVRGEGGDPGGDWREQRLYQKKQPLEVH